ncbi:tRNA (adenosine(37)-N6)-threonylcarbamoyltransferase complex ATPase subunit type 1 TsaE, partial [Candidatus Saccharibacteria bacterium]|nr:tRNA (adenosine(37)-N6)-threonylcarbamoyltransferase complex ATPase subunit type 1 TsaE [Candidatus Saccharibacteria bacterium]
MIIHSEQEMLDFGANFAKRVEKGIIESSSIIELIGDVGAGKTTFVRGLATGLGITEPVTSPSFTISKSYALPSSKGRLIHYDFYRLSDPGLMSEDLADNLTNPSNIIVIEWGASVSDLLPDDHITVFIEKSDIDSREVIIKNNRSNAFRDISRPTGSELARSPVTDRQRSRAKEKLASLSETTIDGRLQSTGATKR